MPALKPVRNLLARAALLAAPAAVLVAVAASSSSPAAATDTTDHSPFGYNNSISTATPGVLEFTGWASDPDNLATNLSISGVVDGATVASTVTSIVRPQMTELYGAGPTPGYVLDVPVPTGNHTVCIAAHNISTGLDTLTRCVFTPLGRSVGSTELATHSPHGRINWADASPGKYQITGYATDPDYIGRRLELAIYIDGSWVQDAITSTIPDVQTPSTAGPRSMFKLSIPVADGAHLGCVWVVNIGPGSNVPLGCRGRDTRGATVGTGTVTPPPVNAQIVAEAKKHLGQQYVWGATGPTKFDCSGLVMYSYSKFHVTTPRVSEDQFRAALKIPASRLVPGDLVFYHDKYGDVYHVGIWLAPGQTIAAIDPAEGVDYQTIWDPNTATYGSFTHN